MNFKAALSQKEQLFLCLKPRILILEVILFQMIIGSLALRSYIEGEVSPWPLLRFAQYARHPLARKR